MPRQSLLEYFQPTSRPAQDIAIIWRQGYRNVRFTYGDLMHAAAHFASQLDARGIGKGDRVLLWGENSGPWVAAFLGCLLRGAVAVPMDAIAEKTFAQRVAQQAGVRLAVTGRGLPSSGFAESTVSLDDIARAADGLRPEDLPPSRLGSPAIERNDLIEIVFTSGTTAEPRGVALTHGNLLANLEPIEREFTRYRRAERILHPLRLLDLLPLSHVFGQLMGIFLPQILGATAIFLDTLNPSEVIRAIHDERVSVLATVPRLVESLRDQIERDLDAHGRLGKFQRDFQAAEGGHFLKRWWRFRAIRRRFGWRFLAVISGGAALSPAAEKFWSRLGYAVIQGYGLTETSSLISLNHPFRLEHGSIGKALPGLEMKLAEDGEILVRGENVAAGYWKDAEVATVLDSDGWFHTGDLGERDANGNLYFKGRRKNVIVTPEGMNVHPEDLEAELRKEPGVRDCVVVGLDRDGNAEPCAVLLLRDPPAEGGGDAATIVERANQRLAPFQQMRHWMVWPGNDFPRTPSQKPALVPIREAVEAQLGGETRVARSRATAPNVLGDILRRISHGRSPSDEVSKLQLTSIERVELLSALEDRYQVDLSETEFTRAETTQEIERLIGQQPARSPDFHYPRWPQSWPLRAIRATVWNLLARPAMLILGWPRIQGRENLRGLRGPALVVANHTEYFDPAYVLEALPERFRHKLAVAMDGERLESMRHPPPGTAFFAGVGNRSAYWLVVSLFNVFPLPQRSGFRRSFAFAGDLVDRGWSVLVFPEGVLTHDGQVGPFRAGIGLLAARLRVPVIPMRLGGIFERKAAGKRWARPGQIKVTIGAAIAFNESDSAEEIARILERRVSALA
ncbi:MAG: AMP-binding protein [Candidatus Acidiferrales bacterium]